MSAALKPDPLSKQPLALTARLLTVEEYLASEIASPVKREYVDGHVYAMAGGRNVHHRIATNFVVALGSRLRGKPCEPFNSDTKVRIRTPTSSRFYYPDGMVVCQSNAAGEDFQDKPIVIAEVLSPSTRRTDEGEKLERYTAIPSLSAYLLIETQVPRVLVYRRTGDTFVPEEYDGLSAVIPLDAIGAELPLAELYERVDFAAAAAESAAETDDAGANP